jgi:hypothetical protein
MRLNNAQRIRAVFSRLDKSQRDALVQRLKQLYADKFDKHGRYIGPAELVEIEWTKLCPRESGD